MPTLSAKMIYEFLLLQVAAESFLDISGKRARFALKSQGATPIDFVQSAFVEDSC